MSSSNMNRRHLMRRAAILGVSAPAMSALVAAEARAQGTPAAAALTGDPIRIGASVSTTGTNGRTGLYQQEAYLLWAAQKNASGGLLGRPVEMVLYDDQSDPTTGARHYERLITEDEVDLVMGPYASGVTQAVAQITERYGYPLGEFHLGEQVSGGFRRLFRRRRPLQGHHHPDRAYVLELGRNRFTGSGEALLADDRVRKLYLGG